jgi:hypothetical protein
MAQNYPWKVMSSSIPKKSQPELSSTGGFLHDRAKRTEFWAMARIHGKTHERKQQTVSITKNYRQNRMDYCKPDPGNWHFETRRQF